MHFPKALAFTKILKDCIVMSEINPVSPRTLSLFGFWVRVTLALWNDVGRVSFLYLIILRCFFPVNACRLCKFWLDF